RNTPDGPEQVVPGASAGAGDIFQVEYHPGNFAYGAILSVDGNGAVTLHWPSALDASTAWSSVTEHRLPKAFELDEAPRFERFHLLLSAKPIDLEKWTSQVAASSKHDDTWLAAQSPQSVRVIVFPLKKGP
nr:ActD-like protein [Fibrobacterota bacterium]